MSEDERALDLVGTDELVHELLRRFDHGVFTAWQVIRDLPDGTSNVRMWCRWKGCTATTVGLCHIAAEKIREGFEADARRFNDDDEGEE